MMQHIMQLFNARSPAQVLPVTKSPLLLVFAFFLIATIERYCFTGLV